MAVTYLKKFNPFTELPDYVPDPSGSLPGGDDAEFQFNDGNTFFGGSTHLTYSKSTGDITIKATTKVYLDG